jgi:energy coupling factor transporter S component ThiW
VLLGPYYALACAGAVGIIRMLIMGIPPLALTGAIFGAVLSGILYRMSKGKLLFAVAGEVIGTGIIGSIISYPVMTFLWGYGELTLFFYTPMFLGATLMGGSVAYILLKILSANKMLSKIQIKLGGKTYEK